MKKFLAILLAAMLLLSVGAVAVAEDAASEATSFTFTKIYNNKENAVVPAETLSFSIVAVDGNPDNTMISITNHKVTGNNDQITVTVPSYETVGKWKYTVTENDAGTQGVTYYTTPFEVTVIVYYDENGELAVSKGISTTDDSGKITSITNQYAVGNLTIEKKVSGNLASTSQKFDINVTFTSDKPVLSTISGAATIASTNWTESSGTYSCTATVSLANGETATFNNIPAGVNYAVAEQDKHFAEDTSGSNPATGYTASYESDSGSIASGATAAAIVTNTKGISIETGITTDSLPYVMLLGFVLLAGAALIIKRRVAHN